MECITRTLTTVSTMAMRWIIATVSIHHFEPVRASSAPQCMLSMKQVTTITTVVLMPWSIVSQSIPQAAIMTTMAMMPWSLVSRSIPQAATMTTMVTFLQLATNATITNATITMTVGIIPIRMAITPMYSIPILQVVITIIMTTIHSTLQMAIKLILVV